MSDHGFKVGDKVRCLFDTGGFIEAGTVLTIESIEESVDIREGHAFHFEETIRFLWTREIELVRKEEIIESLKASIAEDQRRLAKMLTTTVSSSQEPEVEHKFKVGDRVKFVNTEVGAIQIICWAAEYLQLGDVVTVSQETNNRGWIHISNCEYALQSCNFELYEPQTLADVGEGYYKLDQCIACKSRYNGEDEIMVAYSDEKYPIVASQGAYDNSEIIREVTKQEFVDILQ